MADGDDADRSILTRNFGAVITAVVSLIAIGFGFLQFHLESERRVQDKKIEHDRAERAWKLALTQFATENYDQIFSDDESKRSRLEALMKATFPANLLEGFYEQQARKAATFQQFARSTEALAAISQTQEVPRIAKQTTVYLQYADENDIDSVNQFLEMLRTEGFRTPGRELVTKFEFRADVRYFHESDRDTAERVLAGLQGFLAKFDRLAPEKPTNLAKAYPNVPEGIIEIWVPKLSGN